MFPTESDVRDRCLALKGRPATTAAADPNEPLSDAAFLRTMTARIASEGDFWVATLARLMPQLFEPEDCFDAAVEKALVQQLQAPAPICKDARKSVDDQVERQKQNATGWPPISYRLLDKKADKKVGAPAQAAPSSCLESVVDTAITAGKAQCAAFAKADRNSVLEQLKRYEFLVIIGSSTTHYAGYYLGQSGAGEERSAKTSVGAQLATSDASVTVAIVPKMTRVAIVLTPSEREAVPVNDVRFSSDDLIVNGSPPMGCIDLDIATSPEQNATVWVDGSRTKSRRVLADQSAHEVRVVDANGGLLARTMVAGEDVKPAGPCHRVAFDLTARAKTLRLPVVVDKSCAAARIDEVGLNDLVGTELDIQLSATGRPASVDSREWTGALRGVAEWKGGMLGLGAPSGTSRGRMDGVDMIGLAASEQFRQSFSALLVTELSCQGTNESQTYQFTSTLMDNELLRSQTMTTVGIEPSAAITKHQVRVTTLDALNDAIRANMRAVLGLPFVYFEDAVDPSFFDRAQSHRITAGRGHNPTASLRVTVRRGGTFESGASTCNAKPVDDPDSLVTKVFPPPASGVEKPEAFEIPAHQLEPGDYTLSADVVECCPNDHRCGSVKSVLAHLDRPLDVQSHIAGPWVRALAGGNISTLPEVGLFAQVGVAFSKPHWTTFSIGPFVGYGLRIITRHSPPTWDSSLNGGTSTLDYGDLGTHSYGWLRHSLDVGGTLSWLFRLGGGARLEVEADPYFDLAFVNTSRIPAQYTDVLGDNARGDVVTQADCGALFLGKLSIAGLNGGAGVMFTNLFDMAGRVFSGKAAQSVTDGGNVLFLFTVGYSGFR